jgi:hypothetical protein
MPGQDLPFGIDLGADGLGDADDDAAGQRAPQAAQAADDDGLEGVEQACGPDRRVEVGAHAEIERGDGDHTMAMAGGEREDVAVVDAHQLGDLRIIGGGAEGAAQLGAVEYEIERQDHADRRGQRQELHGSPAQCRRRAKSRRSRWRRP